LGRRDGGKSQHESDFTSFLNEVAMLRKGKALCIVFSDGRLQLKGPSLAGPCGEGLVQDRADAAFTVRGEHGDERDDAVRAIAKDGSDPG